MPDIALQDRIVGATDQQRSKMLTTMAPDAKEASANVVEQQLHEQEKMDEVSKMWMHVHDAVRAAEEACRKLKDDEGMSAEDAYATALEDFISVVEGMQGEKNPFTSMEEESRARREL